MFGHRIAKRARCSGLVFTASGQLKSVESYGPGGFKTWEQSWRVYRAGYIMLDQVSVSTFDAYLELMCHYSRRYGQAAWAVQCRADVRARLAQLERLRRKGAAEANLVTNSPFSPSKPREWCFRQLVDEGSAFRWRDLEDPGGLVMLSGATSLASAPSKGDNTSALDGILCTPRVSAPLPRAPPKIGFRVVPRLARSCHAHRPVHPVGFLLLATSQGAGGTVAQGSSQLTK